MAADPFEALLKLVLKNDALVGALAQGFAEHAALLLKTLEKCCTDGCSAPATVRHQVLEVKCCDSCAAKNIVKAKKNVGLDDNLAVNLLRAVVMEEQLWVDLPNAIGIRRAEDLVTMVTVKDEPDVPARGSMEWQ